jgi:hypothetical protein
MGTSGSYSGAGGRSGRDIAAGTAAWLDGLAGGGGAGGSADGTSNDDADSADDDGESEVLELPPRLVSGALSQLRPSSGRGSGGGSPGSSGGGGRRTGSGDGGRGGGGLRRSSSRAAAKAGRAGAAAYAYATGDRASLTALGLDLDGLRAVGDPIEVTRRIVGAACGELANGTLEEHEERYVAASVAEWVLEQADGGNTPSPEEIVRYSIATVVAEVLATEISEALNERPEAVAAVAEDELFEAAEVLASKVDLSVSGGNEADLSRAIEDGIDALKKIYGVES